MAFAALASKQKGSRHHGDHDHDHHHHHHHHPKDSIDHNLPVAFQELLSAWTAIHREACEKQIQALHELFKNHGNRPGLMSDASDGPLFPNPPALPLRGATSSMPQETAHVEGTDAKTSSQREVRVEMGVEPKHKASEMSDEASPMLQQDGKVVFRVLDSADVEKELEDMENDDNLLNWWRRCSGLQTVEQWTTNYEKHPAGWGALLMIHGVPEVTGRLRSKVENFAIYSALFLSVSMSLLADPPDHMAAKCDPLDRVCIIQQRLYFYLLELGVAAHMLSILLAMGFVNVLNEAARDADVIRMFARGQGFVATVKCQRAFNFGCFADFASLVVSAKTCLGWDVAALATALLVVVCAVHAHAEGLLAKNGSIVAYWRKSLGGQPDENDPYELRLPLACFQRRAKECRKL